MVILNIMNIEKDEYNGGYIVLNDMTGETITFDRLCDATDYCGNIIDDNTNFW